MSKAEVENLSDEDLKKEWAQVCVAYKMKLQLYLSKEQELILFANFVNMSGEMSKRGLETKTP